MRRIAITGGLASGKSTVCRIFEKSGAYVVDADAIVHRLLSPGTAVGRQVVGLLGTDIVVENQIDRKKIANLVFSDQKKLLALEAILHPAVKREIEKEYETIKNNPFYTFFVVEAPLLYEAKMENMFDTVITVTADSKIAQKRCPLGEKEFVLRMQRQDPLTSKAQKADFTLTNNGDLASLEKATLKLIKEIQ